MHISILFIYFFFNLAETQGCSRISKGAIQRSTKSSSKDTHWPIIDAYWKLGGGTRSADRDAIPSVSPQRLIKM